MTTSTEPVIKTTTIGDEPESPSNSALSSKLDVKFITHHPKSGLNPLTDCAAYLFSVIGKLKQLKSYRHLSKLNKELVTEITLFEEAAKAKGYSSEYIVVSRYALCATLDDIISNTTWGGQGQWGNYSLLSVFNQESLNPDRFFVILERVIKEPAQYIDVMEFMYICLSLGFKGNYRATEFGLTQIEQITNALYKRIRLYHGDYHKALAPAPIKANRQIKTRNHRIPLWVIMLGSVLMVLMIFIGLEYMLDTISAHAFTALLKAEP